MLIIWRSAGSQVKAEAEKALVGSDAEVDAFLTQKLDRLARVDDRIAVDRLMAAGGPAMKNSAKNALDAADTDDLALRNFLNTGWRPASDTDLRIRVDQLMAAGGPEVKRAAKTALDAENPQALQKFLSTASVRAEETDLRIRVNQIMAAGGHEVKKAAKIALDAETPEALRLFMAREWEVAEARDQETASIGELAAAARVAGEQAARETQAAKDSAEKALREADLARQATELAEQAAKDAKDNAEGAAAAAEHAADAANRAAGAAVTAIGAANAAAAAARVAANAATRAAAAAAKAGRASSTAWHFAAVARVDRGHAGDATAAAVNAAEASKSAQDAVHAIDLVQGALTHAREAIDAASSAGQNASKSADAAQESVRWAKAAGMDARQAEAAAATSRRQAGRAVRAASSARAYADEAAGAAGQARELASRAAMDAGLAAAAADEAAAHAGESAQAAQLATDHANAATQAAQIAIDAAAQAQRLYTAARKVDDDRIAMQADQATEAAQQSLQVHDQLGLTRDRNAAQEAQRDNETDQWLAAATAPGADPGLVAANGRKIALRLLSTGGSWTKAAAQGALSGADPEVRAFVQTGIAQAAALDDRETVRELISEAKPGMKEAGERALAGSDADVKQFLQTPVYHGQEVDDRIAVDQVMAAARTTGDTTVLAAARKALDSENDAEYRKFLDTGQNVARETDDRIAVNQVIADPASGPETRLLGRAALDGSPEIIRQYRDTGRHVAARHDREAAAHNAVVAGLVAEATSVAATASQNAATAQSVAATARNAAAEAAKYADDAKGFATAAGKSAQQAAQSAQDAQNSAREAAQSAEAARQAATRASQSAVRATRSAVSARRSATIAAGYAQSAIQAAHQAYQDALDATKDANIAISAANEARDLAVARANNEMADAKAKFAAEVNKTCESVPAGADHDDCVNRATRMIADPKGESERNVAICNQFKQNNEKAFNNCLKGAYDPSLSYQINKAFTEAKEKADSDRWWSIGGTIVAGAVIVGAGIFCAQVCTAPLVSALVGAEGGFLAEAAGAGVGLTIGAEFIAGVAADGFLASRLSALTQIDFLGNLALRNGLANLESQFAQRAADCNSFTPETRVLLADGSRRAIKDVKVGDVVTATDSGSGVTKPEPVTDLISSIGRKDLVEVRTHGDHGAGTVTATKNLPFWSMRESRWVNAGQLVPGEQLRQSDGRVATVDAVNQRVEVSRVHNLTVEDLHTYYVMAGETPVIVHNSTCILLGTSLTVAEAANPIMESLRTVGKLPPNFVLKEVAEAAGWRGGKPVGTYIPEGQIGGDIYKNAPKDPDSMLLPVAPGRIYYEVDVGINPAISRSKQPGWRLVYSSDGLAYVTFNHYKIFYQLPNWK
ncbi:polymorphic toxin-type HINT domain-containing protein [Amycolatopsis panacis]|uniref:Hint domain-containing protein n=1 Tax=Amycolatopsis panacis TaxID=2340917 RepID=A0A419I9Y5_9PSEU|nr:polymorphic toxin-type HINT domain-containing protein [Amycolatopsis panacis]RJQ89988.1 hypothetical protein D5S19_03235 [Amycolatopsis panacis]